MKTWRLLLAPLLAVGMVLTAPPAAHAEPDPTDPPVSASSAPADPDATTAPSTTDAAASEQPGSESASPGQTDATTTTVQVDMGARESTPAETPTPSDSPNVHIGRGEIPVGKTGEQMDMTIPLKNWGTADALNIRVTPQLAVDAENFPFEITETDYTAVLDSLAAGADGQVAITGLQLRPGLTSGYYRLPLTIEYSDGTYNRLLSTAIFINVAGVPEPEPSAPPPVTTTPPQTVEIIVHQDPGSGGGGLPAGEPGGNYQPPPVSNPTAEQPGSGGSGQGSTPRVMLTNFATNPPEVQAGSTFGLAFALQNMSSRTGVANLKVTVVAPDAAFLPVGGASSVYIPSIGAGQTATRQLEFRALPTLEERPYQLTLRIEYEDASNNAALTAEETIAVVVRQRARAETGAMQVLPSQVSVGQDANISFTVQNQGKVRLFNTRVRVKDGQAVTGNEIFVGNVEPGASANVDLMVHAEQATTHPIILEISYEDSAGVATTIEREVTLEIIDLETEQTMEPEPQPEEGGGLGIVPLLLLGLLVIGGIVAAYVVRERRRARREEELAADLEHLDADPIVPVDPQ